jgi:thiol:disulfide interchange protein DsbC
MVAVWCADDPNKAMTDAKAGKAIDTSKTCETKIPQQYELAQKLGVTGTPAMILPTGELLPGYLPAKRLAAYLDEQKTQAKK